MNIDFGNDTVLQEMQEAYNTLASNEALFLSHYDLAVKLPEFPADAWKQFLQHPKVVQWFDTEMEMYKNYQLRQMIRDATKNDRSVGAASMINSLTKSLNEGRTKDGPIIIYTHVPLTDEQTQSPVDSHTLPENIFLSPDLQEANEWTDHNSEDTNN